MLRVDPESCTPADLAAAVVWLRDGGVVAFPTDTFYGLAADPQSQAAIQLIYEIKGRGADAALPFVAASRAQVEAWCGLGDRDAMLADAFWPGPLSIVRPAPASIAPAALAGQHTVAVRVPHHAVAQALAAAWGGPLPATSANRSGEPPARRAADMSAIVSPRLLIIDGGITTGGAPSTIVDARESAPILVRAGAIAWDRVLHSLHR